MAYYRISGKQDGEDYGRYDGSSEIDAIDKMLNEAGVKEKHHDNFSAEKVFLLTDIVINGD